MCRLKSCNALYVYHHSGLFPLLESETTYTPVDLFEYGIFSDIQAVFQAYVLINLPFTYSTTYEKKHKKNKHLPHFYKTIHVFHKYSKNTLQKYEKIN